MTLDEYLAEIDRWKQPLSDQALTLSAAQRADVDREARNWLEAKLGRALRKPLQPRLTEAASTSP
jgi:hypothetical protein